MAQMEFLSFLNKLQSQNKKKNITDLILAGNWTQNEKKLISQNLSKVSHELIGKIPKKVRRTDSNQRAGNLYHEYFLEIFDNEINGSATFSKFKYQGYPDNVLTIKVGNNIFSYCVEFKATSDWNSNDSNRRVLLSSTNKINKLIHEQHLPNAPKHLILTIIYNKKNFKIDQIRCDFLEPTTKINYRFESSTSHKLLDSNNSDHIIFN